MEEKKGLLQGSGTRLLIPQRFTTKRGGRKEKAIYLKTGGSERGWGGKEGVITRPCVREIERSERKSSLLILPRSKDDDVPLERKGEKRSRVKKLKGKVGREKGKDHPSSSR